jgi:hypothetical protein
MLLSVSLIIDILNLPTCHLYLSICHRSVKFRPEVCAVGCRPLSHLGVANQPRPPRVSPAAEEIIMSTLKPLRLESHAFVNTSLELFSHWESLGNDREG